MESPAPTDRMPKNSRMNNYFLIGGWQRKSGITNFPKFCIELHSSLLTAGCWRPGHRQKVCGQKMQRAAGTSPAQPSQPSPASPAQAAQHLTYKLCTNPPPGRHSWQLSSSNMLPGVSQPFLSPPRYSVDSIFALMVDATGKGFNNLLKPNFVLHMGVTVIPNLPRLC